MAGTLSLHCIHPGGGAFVVDAGRPNLRALGIARGGAADPLARADANRLLGRATTATCLELTLTGGRWLFSGQGQIVLTGADFGWRLNGQPADTYSVVFLDGDYLLSGSQARHGLRGYLAINGNWDLPSAQGSVEEGLPGIPPIQKGWNVRIPWEREAAYRLDLPVPAPTTSSPLRVFPGPEWDTLPADWQRHLLQTSFRVARDSNRQGIRLESTSGHLPAPLPAAQRSLLSSPVLPGTVQLTPSGPILLGPTAQTVGGYPRVLVLATVEDHSQAFQTGLSASLAFQLVTTTP
ncbi:biotin-dependent carboxyltransferase family protein [Neolewinella lacunae]|uniref:Biotin-dependent carboxyltransferase family protein n=1 Tax=Neolewinella lacunae TaxID=1517758 RepID=A0A923PQA2_9BACT|nr:biotin-dependent carboxyltransferase family protein [Neolewinella lacunae]MBC6996575.1 biotin-dependent carboxyltransferase family protein [Neolewinella lacunae]MDN3634861.1 biotin-dependent carboxyltransferase family protein [Neolewinella lacunae]